MMTELLIVKSGSTYYRLSDGGFSPCTMNKASVFSLQEIDAARSLCDQVRGSGVAAHLMKLTIREEPLME